MDATVTHDGHSTTGTFVVVKSSTALLGLDLFVALHMCISGNKVVTNTSPKDPHPVKYAPTAPSTPPLTASEAHVREVGCAKGFVHKIHLKQQTVPLQQKLRRLPFSVRQAVMDELKEFLEKGIIGFPDSCQPEKVGGETSHVC